MVTVRGAHASTLDWRTLLRRYMTDTARSDYSWSLPNRRFIDTGLYLPSIRSEGIDTVAVIIDTSGSVDTDALAAFWTEVREIVAEIRPNSVIVLQVDATLQDAAEYAPGDLPEQIALTCRSRLTISSGFIAALPSLVLLVPKPKDGPIRWGRISSACAHHGARVQFSSNF